MRERTSAEVRRAIAERLWGDRPEREYPNWPEDTDAALALCLDVLDRLNGDTYNWELVFGAEWVAFKAIGGTIADSYSVFGRDADALARLALAALEGGA